MLNSRPHSTSREKIEQFKLDVAALGFSHMKIAEKMGIGKANFSSYFNEKQTHTITNKFLNKFYDSWGKELEALDKDSIGECLKRNNIPYGSDEFEKLDHNRQIIILTTVIEEIQKNVRVRNKDLNECKENYSILLKSNEKLVETNQKLLDEYFSLLRKQEGNPTNGSADGKV